MQAPSRRNRHRLAGIECFQRSQPWEIGFNCISESMQ
jgi:hypothetical protein